MEEETSAKIINYIKSIVRCVDADCEINREEIGEKFYSFNVKTRESSLLIGRDGANIGAIDHLAKLMLKKEMVVIPSFVIDINGYRKAKIERLKQLAKSAALRVSWRNQAETLFPMNAFERRIVHMELSNSPLVETKSAGQEPNRSVVVSPLKNGDGKKSLDIDEIINS